MTEQRIGKSCEECFFKRQKFVGSRGPAEARVVVVAESPGPLELAKSKAFIGPGADLLLKNLPKGVDPSQVLFMYAQSCYPAKVKDAKKNLKLSQSATRACNKRMRVELLEHPRDIIIAFGNAALWAVTGNYEHKITRDRGVLLTTDLAVKGVIGTYHPLYLMRGGGSLPKFKEDLEYAFSLSEGGARRKPIVPSWFVAQNASDVLSVLAQLRDDAQRLGMWDCGTDHETGGFDFRNDEVLCVGLCIDPHMVYIIPEELIPLTEVIFSDANIEFIWHNGKFDIKFNHTLDIPGHVDGDTMLMNYSMNEQRGMHDLEQVASDVIGAPSYKAMLKPYLPNKRTSYRVIPKPVLYEYLAYDASNTIQVHRVLKERLAKDALSTKLYNEVLLKASYLLAEVEKNGILVDLAQQKLNDAYYLEELEGPKAEMNVWSQEYLGKDINPGSWQQLKELMYGPKGIRIGNMGMSTDADTLEKLPPHPFVKLLQKFRTMAKAHGTYIKSLPDQILDDGRVHSTYLIHGTATGRLASRNPNMQNQPRVPRIRNQFIAAEGWEMFEFDLDQAELRCLAALSGDKELCRIYETQGMSLHKEVSIDLWGKDWVRRYALDDPDNPEWIAAKEEYMRTKALNFGIIYGREAPSIAEEFDVPTSEAQRWIDSWATRFPEAWAFIEKCRMAPLRGQNLITPFGRRKRVGVVSRDKLRSLQNEAANFPHQSIASDITLMSAYHLQKWIERNNLQDRIKIINLIHDAIIVEAKQNAGITEPLKRKATMLMEEEAPKWGVTRIAFSADAKVGQRWGELKDTPVDRELNLTDYQLAS